MLILTRRIGEQLRVGDDISVMVLEVQGNQVRLGINAPREIDVHREEIYRRVQAERKKRGIDDDDEVDFQGNRYNR